MSLPTPVSDYLLSLLAEKQAPLTAEVDLNWRLTALHGDTDGTGLPDLTPGSDLRNALPFLHGQDAGESFVLPMIELPERGVFNVHGVAAGTRVYILFLPADEERRMRRDLQQKANEVRLLNHRQKRLVEQLTATKSDLEAREHALVRANDIKARFIAGMSHEFRTPLTSILGYAELIEESTAQGGADHVVDGQIRSVSRAARHLLSMVDNILDQARLEDGEVVLTPQATPLRELVDDLTAILAPLAAARFLGFAAFVDANVPESVLTDSVRVRQILLNLLGNAIKFTEQGQVRLEMSWDDGVLTCAVSDTGPGIAPSQQTRIFDAFARGEGSENVRGVGLGLNITQRLCALLGGNVSVQSALGEGSTFTVRLPMPAVELGARSAEERRHVATSRGGAHILVAEDDPDIIELVQIILGRADYQVTVAMNGQDAVEQAIATPPDLVLMDVNMPLMNGLEAASAMRKAGLSCPIIALSASLGLADRDDAMLAGYDAYLLKPISQADLLAAIAGHLESAVT